MMKIEPKLIDDNALLEKIKSGHKSSFNILFDRYWENSLNDAFKRTKDLNTAKDIVQEIFTCIWINRETQIDNFPAYIATAIRNKVFKFVATQKPVHPFFDALENISAKNSYADSDLLWKEFYQSYEDLLATLPLRRRDIFRMHVQEGLSTKIIAVQLGIARKTVQNQLGKAIETLKVSLIRFVAIGLFLLISAS